MNAQEALEITLKNKKKTIPNIKDIFSKIEYAAENGHNSIELDVVVRDLTNEEIVYLNELGYEIEYSRVLLQHTISW